MSDIMFLHSPPLKSQAVGDLQTLLKKHGWYEGPIDHEFGPLTAQAVYRAKYWLGYPKPDHIAGPILHKYLTGSKTPTSYRVFRTLRQRKRKQVPVGQKVLLRALSFLGTKESPPGSNIVLFSSWYGMIGSWCAMFVSYNWAPFSKIFKAGHYYAYVPYIVADARAARNGLVVAPRSALRDGDIACFDWPGESPGVADHTGLYASVSTLQAHAPNALAAAIREFGDLVPGDFWAIEGNTGVGNDSNGGEVMLRKRSQHLVQLFARPTR